MNDCCIAGFGEVMLRLCPPGRHRLLQALPGTLDATFGGSEVNVCASLAMLGANCRFLTALPDHTAARAVTLQLKGLGCDVSHILYSNGGRMGVYYVEHGSDMRSSTVIYDRDHSVISELGPDAYDFTAMLEGVSHLHLSDITCALTEKAFQTTLALARFAAVKGITISLDINNRKKLWNWNPKTTRQALARECLEQLAPLADMIIGNREDTSAIFGFKAPTAIGHGRIDFGAYEKSAKILSERFPKARYIAFTLRETISADRNNWGGMLYDSDSKLAHFAPLDSKGEYAPYELRDIVDRFGGGDAFSAGLLFALHSRTYAEPAIAVRFAAAASVLKHTIPGDYNYTTRAEVEELMQGFGAGRIQR